MRTAHRTRTTRTRCGGLQSVRAREQRLIPRTVNPSPSPASTTTTTKEPDSQKSAPKNCTNNTHTRNRRKAPNSQTNPNTLISYTIYTIHIPMRIYAEYCTHWSWSTLQQQQQQQGIIEIQTGSRRLARHRVSSGNCAGIFVSLFYTKTLARCRVVDAVDCLCGHDDDTGRQTQQRHRQPSSMQRAWNCKDHIICSSQRCERRARRGRTENIAKK